MSKGGPPAEGPASQALSSYYPSLETITPSEEIELETVRRLCASSAPVQLVPDKATFDVNGVRFVSGILSVCELAGRRGPWCIVRNQAMLDSQNQRDILFPVACLTHVSVPGGCAAGGAPRASGAPPAKEAKGDVSGGAPGDGDDEASHLVVLYFADTPRCLNLVFQRQDDRAEFARTVLGCGGYEAA